MAESILQPISSDEIKPTKPNYYERIIGTLKKQSSSTFYFSISTYTYSYKYISYSLQPIYYSF